MVLYYRERMIVWDIEETATIFGKNTEIVPGFLGEMGITISDVGEEKVEMEEEEFKAEEVESITTISISIFKFSFSPSTIMSAFTFNICPLFITSLTRDRITYNTAMNVNIVTEEIFESLLFETDSPE
jgi:hypothetical protein